MDGKSAARQHFGFATALLLMRAGEQVSRDGWNGKSMWVAIKWPDPSSEMDFPYFYMCTAQGGFVPWLASQTDILANDWRLL